MGSLGARLAIIRALRSKIKGRLPPPPPGNHNLIRMISAMKMLRCAMSLVSSFVLACFAKSDEVSLAGNASSVTGH